MRIEYSAPSAESERLQRAIPVCIPALNNPTYLRQMVDQRRSRKLENLIVLDNGSTFPEMLSLLASDFGPSVGWFGHNAGPRYIVEHEESFGGLPELFGLTDPDLELNPEVPIDFVATLVDRTGLSLDISDRSALRDEAFDWGYTIWEWEQQFWADQIGELVGLGPVYCANLDTTFAVYNQTYLRMETFGDAVRVAGVFTCRHLPYDRDHRLPPEEARVYQNTQRHSHFFPQQSQAPPLECQIR
jgi:hypothetical protein